VPPADQENSVTAFGLERPARRIDFGAEGDRPDPKQIIAADEAKAAREKKADEEAGLVTAQRWTFAVSRHAMQAQQS